ncbi:hypothetical protein J3Q64DRAFT_1632279 [Phycomyces blakesleeanus]|uniref:Cyclin-like domain-containing protein n=1 Tax=Phycomyces blakesleeanus TaxID=4837 RepID=A0ABR3BI65_PHYBL
MRCRCGSSKVESDPSTGTVYCVGCGEVLEENTMVSEVSFHEMSGGKTVLSGSYAGESGRQKIARLSFALHLSERFREAAQRYYNLAVVNRFTRGRKSDHVAAVNVFMLGATFLKLVRVLCLKLPLVDPSIYISRFAAALDFGEYTQRVAQDAVRLVQRMDRDWIRTGRRPAGICGACLLIAARVNGFRRTTREMIYIVKVADVTIQKRLKEFNTTDSSNLSVRDFRTMWLETEADPPAFVKNKKKANAEKEAEENEAEEDETEETGELNKCNDEDFAFVSNMGTVSTSQSQSGKSLGGDHNTINTLKQKPNPNSKYDDQVEDEDEDEDDEVAVVDARITDSIIERIKQEEDELDSSEYAQTPKPMQEDFIITASDFTRKQNQDESLSDVDDEEIEAMILTNDEVNAKTIVWYNANKEYLEEMAAKARKQEMDRKNGIFTKKGKSGKRKRPTQANTPAEAAKQLVIQKKLSKKINQAVFDDMFESPESIAKIKAQDKLKRTLKDAVGDKVADTSSWEIVEEPGEAGQAKRRKSNSGAPGEEEPDKPEVEDEEDDEDMDLDDMADDERLLREARSKMGWDEAVTEDNYYDYDEY